MTANTEEQELKDRLSLIENMIARGAPDHRELGLDVRSVGCGLLRCHCVVHVGTEILRLGRSRWAWPVTMISAAVLTLAIGIGFGKGTGHAETTMGRAITSIWSSVGIAMLLLFPALGYSGRLEQHSFVAIVAAMLGVANGASGMILKWKMQIACAMVWWVRQWRHVSGRSSRPRLCFWRRCFFARSCFGSTL
jgi:hypothetical protein